MLPWNVPLLYILTAKVGEDLLDKVAEIWPKSFATFWENTSYFFIFKKIKNKNRYHSRKIAKVVRTKI